MKEILSKANTRRLLATLEEAFPDSGCLLAFETPFQLLVATMLMNQSTAEKVNALTGKLFAKYPGPTDFVKLTSDELQEEIQELGIFRAKSDHIIGAAQRIVDWYKGEVPRTQEELVKLPGVGRKTANLVIANAYGIPAIAIDPHIQRTANRIGMTNSMNPEITEKQLCQRIPQRLWTKTHHILYRLSREYCTAKNPDCYGCPAERTCQFRILLDEDDKLREKVFVEQA